MKPNFCIITTTYKRPESVLKSIDSVRKQTYANWLMIIVIDDIESNYDFVKAQLANDPKIICLQNEQNIGKNASVNHALDELRKKSFLGHIVFLDDDDWLAPNCLFDFATVIECDLEKNWLVSQRVNILNKEPFTINKTGRKCIDYLHDVLFFRKFSGDATHCINFATSSNLTFPTQIKNAEEWLYFATLAKKHPKFTYIPKAGTYSEGYATLGLTDIYHQKKESRGNNFLILKEASRRKLFSPYILLYIFGRLIKSIF